MRKTILFVCSLMLVFVWAAPVHAMPLDHGIVQINHPIADHSVLQDGVFVNQNEHQLLIDYQINYPVSTVGSSDQVNRFGVLFRQADEAFNKIYFSKTNQLSNTPLIMHERRRLLLSLYLPNQCRHVLIKSDCLVLMLNQNRFLIHRFLTSRKVLSE